MSTHHFLFAALIIALVGSPIRADLYQPEANSRCSINLGDSPWKFLKEDPFPAAESPSYDDSSWTDVGVPHCFNDQDTFVNVGAGVKGMFRGTVWYRKHFKLDAAFNGKKIFIEFQGVNIACAVYVNGKFVPNNSKVAQPGEVTHVFGFTPFVIDVTDDVKFGDLDNVLAVRVSNNKEKWYTWPGFGNSPGFGMGSGGIFRPVYLHVTDPVHIPLNVFSNVNQWGTSLATLSADKNTAEIQIQTNVVNDGTSDQNVTLVTQVVDEQGQVVLEIKNDSKVAAGETHLFDQTGKIAQPHLWFPNDGSAKPQYLYKVYSIVRSAGRTTDVFESPLGIRTIKWDADYPYFNGVRYDLYGFGTRYDYPGLGTAVPEARQWADMQLAAECGGNLLRPGHVPCAPATVDACDRYGIALAQPSGDNEGAFRKDAPDTLQYKREVHRDIIVRDRNHPSIAFWEASNGGFIPGFLPELVGLTAQWDNLTPRETAPRATVDYPTAKKQLDICPDRESVKVLGACHDGIATKIAFPTHPVWTAESWIASAPRYDWDESIFKAEIYVKKVQDSKQAKLFGFAHWYLAETTGENEKPGPHVDVAHDHAGGAHEPSHSRSLDDAAMDGNRIPELIYNVYKNAVLIPYSIRPGVTLGGNWNRSGTVEVKAWSNCPAVKLYLNGVDLGTQTPEGPFDQDPFRAIWQVPWQAGTLKAVGISANGQEVCSDQLVTAGEPDHVELSVDAPTTGPDGHIFAVEANGTNAAYVLARIVDKDGNVCPLAHPPITFSVSGPGKYCGSWNQEVYDGKPIGYHAPGDPELDAEAGQMKVAVRATFTPGTVVVTATSPGLQGGTTTFQTVAVKSTN